MRPLTLILTGVGLLLGCDSEATDPEPTDLIRDEAAPVQTGSLLYVLERDAVQGSNGWLRRLQTFIDYRYTNPTDQTIYIVKCRTVSFRLEKLGVTGEWVAVWAGRDYTRCLGEPTVVQSGAMLSGTLEVSGYEPNSQAWPQFAVPDMEGVFRLILLSAVYLEDASEYPDGIEVEPEHLYSNHFELRVH